MFLSNKPVTHHHVSLVSSGFGTGIYTTNSAEACQYVADNCQANVIVVENKTHLGKILKVWDKLPHLKAVVQYTGKLEEKIDNVYTVSCASTNRTDWGTCSELVELMFGCNRVII